MAQNPRIYGKWELREIRSNMLSGYEKRMYICDVCGEFEVSTEGYHKCECGKYQGLQLEFERGMSKHWDYPNHPFPPHSRNVIEKRVDDFAFLTQEEKEVLDRIESKSSEVRKVSDIRGSVRTDKTIMPDGRTEITDFTISLEQYKMFKYAPSRTNEIYMSRDLTKKFNGLRDEVLADLLNIESIIDDILDNGLDLFEKEEELKEKHAWDNNYDEIIVDNFVFYPRAA